MTDREEPVVVLERVFDAPRSTVWALWTVPEHFASWYGPTGATIHVRAMDVRVGGRRVIGMEMATPNGAMLMWFAGEHVEVVADRLLAYSEFVSDEHGVNVDPSGGGVTIVRVELEDLAGRTRMVLRHFGIPSGSPGEAGWTMALDEFAAELARPGA